MIPKLNSNQCNDIFKYAQQRIEDYNTDIQKIKKDLNSLIQVSHYELEYARNYINNNLVANITQSGYNMFSLTPSVNTHFSSYGSVVHPKVLSDPTNIFNLTTISDGKYYFRNDPLVYVNDIYSLEYQDILKHDSFSKKMFFDLYDDSFVNIKIRMPSSAEKLGSTYFNMFEIDSFLNGSYDLVSFSYDVMQINGQYTTTTVGTDEEPLIKSCGKLRYVFNEKIDFSEINLKFKLNYPVDINDTVKYPFGLKHLYFYNADFLQYTNNTDDTTNILSYAILEIPCSENKYFNTVNKTVKLVSPDKFSIVNAADDNIKFYAHYNSIDGLSNEITPSSYEENLIAHNIQSLYVYIPLVSVNYDGTVDNHTYSAIGVNYSLR